MESLRCECLRFLLKSPFLPISSSHNNCCFYPYLSLFIFQLQNQIQIWPNRLVFSKERKASSNNYNNGWETSVNGIFVIERHVMVGGRIIFIKIVTTKDLPWS